MGTMDEKHYRIGKFGLGDQNENGERLAALSSTARLLHRNSFFVKKEHRQWTWELPSGMAHAEIDHILTNKRWCLLDTSVAPFFCTGSDLRLLRAKILFSRKLEKKICHRTKRKLVVYDGKVLSDILSIYEGQMKDDPTEDYELLMRGLQECV